MSGRRRLNGPCFERALRGASALQTGTRRRDVGTCYDLSDRHLYGIRFAATLAKQHWETPLVEEIWTTVVSEFSDVPDVSTITRITLRLLLAAVLGGILGYEREQKGRSAGLRTHMLVAVGAALFVIGPTQAGMSIEDMSRVIQGIVQGIGFLGAGAIIVRTARKEVEGLTTAANIWATAGIGVIVGLGLEATAVLSAAIILIILAAVPLLIPAKSDSPELRE